MSVWRGVLRAGGDLAPGPGATLRGHALRSLRVRTGRSQRTLRVRTGRSLT